MRALTLLAMPNGPAQLAGAALSQAAQYLERVSRQSVTVKVLGQEYLQDLATVNSGDGPEWVLTKESAGI